VTWLLHVLVLAYRRWLSGRGPLRDVACTFAHAESCSAYALRLLESRGGLRALRLIRRRLRRCGDASLYRLSSGRLGWGELHERSDAAVARELTEAHELPASQALVLRSRALIDAQRGASQRAARSLRRAASLCPARSRVIVRDAARSRAGRRALLLWRATAAVAIAAACLAVAALVDRWWAAVVAGLVVAFLALSMVRPISRHLALLARLDDQAVLARFVAPAAMAFTARDLGHRPWRTAASR